MDTDLTNLHWFKSSASAAGNCVEVAHLPGGGVAVRDSKDRGGPELAVSDRAWSQFVRGIKQGEFGLA